MKKPTYKLGDARDPKTGAPLVFRRRRAPADSGDLLIRIVAAVLLVAAGVAFSAHFKEKKNLQTAALAAQTQERDRLVALDAANRQAELERQRSVQMQQSAQSGRQLYRCVDRNGTTSIQNAPCPADAAATWAQQVPSESALQSSLREQEWVRQQGEARLRQEEARFAEVTGTGNGVQTYYSTRTSDRAQLEARCQAQKNYRDATLRQVGLNRTFDLIRQLDEQVYEACKGL